MVSKKQINFKKGGVMLVEVIKRIDFFINSKILGKRYVKRKLKYFSMYLDFSPNPENTSLKAMFSRFKKFLAFPE